jgi:GDPmannose 4,6-dehydratase
VQEFLELAFTRVGLDWKEFVRHDICYKRPAEVDLLVGDASKAKRALGWQPKVRFPELVQIMVDADLASLQKRADGVLPRLDYVRFSKTCRGQKM